MVAGAAKCVEKKKNRCPSQIKRLFAKFCKGNTKKGGGGQVKDVKKAFSLGDSDCSIGHQFRQLFDYCSI